MIAWLAWLVAISAAAVLLVVHPAAGIVVAFVLVGIDASIQNSRTDRAIDRVVGWLIRHHGQ